MNTQIIILAAGQGSRMKSTLPKVLQPLGGQPLLKHIVNAALQCLAAKDIYIVVGYQADSIQKAMQDYSVNFIKQPYPKGTGDAVAIALSHMEPKGKVIVLYGDVPLVKPSTIKKLIDINTDEKVGLITAIENTPNQYGKIIRNQAGQVTRIIEHKHADSKQKQITEINTGLLAANKIKLAQWLNDLQPNLITNEFYLTDIIEKAYHDHYYIETIMSEEPWETKGVNNKTQLAAMERNIQYQYAQQLMNQGVTLLDPMRFDCRGQLLCGHDVTIDINVIIIGKVIIGDHVTIGAGAILIDVEIQSYTNIKPYSIIEKSTIKQHCQIGPFARIRPDSLLNEQVHIGNFVEIKKSNIDYKTKINHLSYIGDAIIGCNVNIGAGTITCNYDGQNKHQTHIGDEAFVGSNTALVAPVSIAKHSTIAAGSTITKTVEQNALGIARNKQKNIQNWKLKKTIKSNINN